MLLGAVSERLSADHRSESRFRPVYRIDLELPSYSRYACKGVSAVRADDSLGLCVWRPLCVSAAVPERYTSGNAFMSINLSAAFIEGCSDLVDVRRDLHAHPELAFEEQRTADVVASKLSEWDIQVHRGLGKTGVVGILRHGDSSRTIGLRADMDALAMQEHNTFPHASTIPGKMHGCGHDGHTAMLLAAAKQLSKNRNFDGTVYFIFQPAEEGAGGARVMIEEGLFEKFPMEAVFGMHNFHGLPEGQFCLSPGPVMAGTAKFKIVIRGKGAHAAMPHLSVDPVPPAAAMIQAFQNIVSRNKDPKDACVLSVTMCRAGESINVIPDFFELQGVVRAFSSDVLEMVEQRMRSIAQNICAAFDTHCEFTYTRNYPPTVNDAEETAFARRVLERRFGAGSVAEQTPTLGAEDFAFMLQVKPGAYCFLGNGKGDHRLLGHGEGPCVLHNPSYDFNDALIPIGAAYWVALVEERLSVV